MTEAEWDACADPTPLLEFLRGKGSERKLRLFACACCRSVWPCMTDERGRRAVEVAERFADGAATAEEMLAAAHGAGTAEYDAAVDGEDVAGEGQSLSNAMAAAYWAAASAEKAAQVASWGGYPVALTSKDAVSAAAWIALAAGKEEQESDQEGARVRAAQVRLVRCVFGNPFRPPRVEPEWLAWNGGTVVQLAQAIYDERAFDRLPILADALEDAGCHDTDILAHCRQPGEHVRGCWVVDLVRSVD
jgi:hypothetical protein